MSLCCHQDDRRDAVRRSKARNGLDYVEVSEDQLTLTAFFLGKLPPELSVAKPGLQQFLRLTGGQRVTHIQMTEVKPVADPDPEKDDQLVISLDRYGDFSTYTLGLVGVANIDPRYDHVDFLFKMNCPSDQDCAPACACNPPALDEPEINYLAKDYASFRRLIYDRLALLTPDWTERHAPDLGVALVELLAQTGDSLSYYQDAVATEACLDTARLRVSVRRHARLVDYRLHEGCNARAWVCIQTDTNFNLELANASFITDLSDPGLLGKTILQWTDLDQVTPESYEVFEPLPLGAKIVPLYAAHSEMYFYTWGQKECCLARGSTSATLLDGWLTEQTPAQSSDQSAGHKAAAKRQRKLHLQPGDALLFEEVVGPATGNPADADPARRHAVRLTKVTAQEDTLFHQPVVLIEWGAEDALPFPLCLSAIGQAPQCAYLEQISVARGNVLLADHGKTIGPEDLGAVPTQRTESVCECAGRPGEVQVIPGPFAPTLSTHPLTFSEPLPADDAARGAWVPVSVLEAQDPRKALPQARLNSLPAEAWTPRYDLIESRPNDAHFVVENDDDAVPHLRFGDGELGLQPPAEMRFYATYRIGNGSRGNLGPESLSRLVLRQTTVSGPVISIRNPLPARGGADAEPVAEAKLLAPHAFRDPQQIQRAIIAADYALIAERSAQVQRAAAALVWTGSWNEAVVAIDPWGREKTDPELLDSITAGLRPFRRLGHDLRVLPARYVPLDLELEICALPGYQRAHVKAALLDVFSRRALAGGRLGFFHPDNLTFGEGVFLSRIIAAAQAVPGVECARVTRFQRLFEPSNHELENGLLPLRVDEIAQLDNDPNWPEHGRIEIRAKGGY